jgi:hypothetical protein
MTPRELAADHASRRRERLSRIRNTVAAVSVCLFILLFSGIYVQMAAGRDPALSASHGKKAAVVKTSSATSSGSSSSPSSSSDDGYGTSSAQQPAPVTSSQS